MHQNGYSIMLDVSAKFFFYIFIRGWYQHAGDKLEAVQLNADGVRLQRADVKPGYPGLPAEEGFQEWNVQCLMDEEVFPSASEITFVTRSGREVVLKLADLVVEREMLNASAKLDTRFFEEIAREPFKRVLDLGGRDRSKRGLSYFLDRHEVTVFDIHAAPGVDVVGDAHELSSYFPGRSFRRRALSIRARAHCNALETGDRSCQGPAAGRCRNFSHAPDRGDARPALGLLALFRQRLGRSLQHLDGISCCRPCTCLRVLHHPHALASRG